MATDEEIITQLLANAELLMAAHHRLDAATLAHGLPAESTVIVGSEALAAAKDIQAANLRQQELLALVD